VPGLGPGLPIAAALAQAHHATLTISPQPGGGLNIDVTFPTATRTHIQRSLHDKS
jgi:signal transduction histidine kinase